MNRFLIIAMVTPLIFAACAKEATQRQDIVGEWKLVKETSDVGLESGNPDALDQPIYTFSNASVGGTDFNAVDVAGMACAYRLSDDLSYFDMVEDPVNMTDYVVYTIEEFTTKKMELTVEDGRKITLKKK